MFVNHKLCVVKTEPISFIKPWNNTHNKYQNKNKFHSQNRLVFFIEKLPRLRIRNTKAIKKIRDNFAHKVKDYGRWTEVEYGKQFKLSLKLKKIPATDTGFLFFSSSFYLSSRRLHSMFTNFNTPSATQTSFFVLFLFCFML